MRRRVGSKVTGCRLDTPEVERQIFKSIAESWPEAKCRAREQQVRGLQFKAKS